MTLRIGEISLDCSDPERAAQFWCAALGYRITHRDETDRRKLVRADDLADHLV
jgi:catechol 2,3-dioxygenase-like lactoylglutathione lyase family enzyme